MLTSSRESIPSGDNRAHTAENRNLLVAGEYDAEGGLGWGRGGGYNCNFKC